MQNNFYRKDLKYPLNIRISPFEYEFLNHVATTLNKPVATVVRDIIDKEIINNGYSKTSIIHNLEHSTISKAEASRFD